MNREKTPEDLQALNQETQEIWNQNAVWWDEQIGEGNLFQKMLISPATESLLEEISGKVILDIACGNGVFSRRLAQLGAEVVACDFSEMLLECAKARTKEHVERIEYKLIDATNETQLLTLGKRRFDAVVCNMALMDMATIYPLISALGQLLKVGSCFIFSVLHPCFNTNGCKMVVEEEDRSGELITTYAVKVSQYLRLPPAKGLGIIGQPTPHYYFHRSLSLLFNTCFSAGFVLNGIEEPAFDLKANGDRPFSWANYKDIPPVLVARMRLMQTPTSD
jgi:2-polyprenyl-3-methyl-5-hydroxy-6-metoxy-1,4-benzoquinol methylase